ncbi:MAG: hypothetical protein RBS39_07935 [Phycisphaerales bacterium]|jgi:hypothetical protein|nr:hypothetical protein [Phycisphaerales bacterium]
MRSFMPTPRLAAFVALTGASVAAHAQMTMLTDIRSVGAYAKSENAAGVDVDAPADVVHTPFISEFNGQNSAVSNQIGAGAGASVGQLSSFTRNRIQLNASASASTSVNAAGGGIRAESSSNSILDMTFAVIEGTEISIESVITSLTNGARVSFFNSSDDLLFSGPGLYNTTLSAGRYRLLATIDVSADAFGDRTAGGSIALTATFVPAPAGVLALVPLAFARRRR